jgi:putative aminopeptidase FrvX
MDETLEMLKDLTEAPGPSGQEGPVREVMARYLAPFGEVVTDNLGSIVAYKTGAGVDRSTAPRVLLAGHMDEVGFLVTMITDEGFLKFQTLGGWWEQVMLAQRVTVRTRKGDLVGVFGSKPPHILPADERKKMVEMKDMFIDIGVLSKDEAIEAGVRPGDPIVPICPFTVMANPSQLLAKAWDNRAGCALAVQTFRTIGAEHPNTLYAGATVQEEVGLRGAQTLGNLVAPDVALSLDVAIAGDTPEIKPHQAQSKMGKGPTIMIYDGSLIPNLQLHNLIVDVAEEEGIPYQFDSMSAGGTDGGKLQFAGNGVPAITLSVATRYIHSAASILNLDDFNNCVRLLNAVVKRLDADTVAGLKR